MELCVSLFDCLQCWTFKMAFCFLSFRESAKIFTKLPVTPFYFDLKMRHLWQALLKALEISRNIPISSKVSLNDWCTFCAIYKNWYESPCLKYDWFDDIRSFLMKNPSKLLICLLTSWKHQKLKVFLCCQGNQNGTLGEKE